MSVSSVWSAVRYFAGKAPLTSNNEISLMVTTGSEADQFTLWLVNDNQEAKTVSCGELGGFNVGSYVEKPLAKARDLTSLPFILERDFDYLVLVADNMPKKLVTFADLCCDLASSHGATEVTMTDHDCAQTVQAQLLHE